jgi:putative membrane protein
MIVHRNWDSFLHIRFFYKGWLPIIIVLSKVQVVFAHPGEPIAPHDFWNAWNNNFFLLLMLEVTTFIYIWGIWRVWRRAGVGRGISFKSTIAFAGAIVALVIALVSPLDALSNALFSAHMAQHMILILIAAPLLVMSNFPLVFMWALPRQRGKILAQWLNKTGKAYRFCRLLEQPLIAWLLFGITIWAWHAPALYELALQEETIHVVEHLGFLLTAMFFWWILLDSSRVGYSRYGIAIPYLFTTALHTGILGALLTFASEPWYPLYALRVLPWGLDSLQDQQLAGVFMWIPGGASFTFLSILYFGLWMRDIEKCHQIA